MLQKCRDWIPAFPRGRELPTHTGLFLEWKTFTVLQVKFGVLAATVEGSPQSMTHRKSIFYLDTIPGLGWVVARARSMTRGSALSLRWASSKSSPPAGTFQLTCQDLVQMSLLHEVFPDRPKARRGPPLRSAHPTQIPCILDDHSLFSSAALLPVSSWRAGWRNEGKVICRPVILKCSSAMQIALLQQAPHIPNRHQKAWSHSPTLCSISCVPEILW